MIHGENITVIRRTQSGVDAHNKAIYTETQETIENVLVGIQTAREQGADEYENTPIIGYKLYIPKTYTASLFNCEILVRGERFKVVGDPKGYAPCNIYGEWNRSVVVNNG